MHQNYEEELKPVIPEEDNGYFLFFCIYFGVVGFLLLLALSAVCFIFYYLLN